MHLVTIELKDLTSAGISVRGNVICRILTGDTVLVSRTNMNKLLNGQKITGAFNKVEGFDLPMFMVLKF